jgi:indole-3-glycerol phosphate synthase
MPETILDRIVADTRQHVALCERRLPISALEVAPYYASPTLPLGPALRQDRLQIIAELKKASPSKGIIRADFDPELLARGYKHAGAAALSVLTEPKYFLGSIENLKVARHSCDLPLLRKDFIVDRYQLHEARAAGADAVLLIAAVLEASELYDLHAEADELGLSCLVEVYDAGEMDKLDFDQVRVLGVNNRDLRTFEVDINHSLRVFKHAPEHVVKVSESGLKTADDLAHLRRHGVDAVLMGESLMRAPVPKDALRKLIADVDRALVEGKTPLRLVG